MIELVHVRLADFGPETQLVLSRDKGNDVRQVAGDVIAAFRRGQPDLLKPRDGDVGSPQNGLAVNGGIRAEEQT